MKNKKSFLSIFLLLIILISSLNAGWASPIVKAIFKNLDPPSYHYDFNTKLSEYELKQIKLENILETKIDFQERLNQNNIFSKQSAETKIELYQNQELLLDEIYIKTKKFQFNNKHFAETDLTIEYDAIVNSQPQLISLLPKTELEYTTIYKKDEISINEHNNIDLVNKYILKLKKDDEYISINSVTDLKKYIVQTDNNLIPIVAHSETGRNIMFPDGSEIKSEDLHIYCHNQNKSCIILSCYSQDLNIDYKITSNDAIDIWISTLNKYKSKQLFSIKDFKINLKKELLKKRNKQLVVNTLSITVTINGIIYTIDYYNNETKFDIDKLEEIINISRYDKQFYNKGLELSKILLQYKYNDLKNFRDVNNTKKEIYEENFFHNLFQNLELRILLNTYDFEEEINPKYLTFLKKNKGRYYYKVLYLAHEYKDDFKYKTSLKILNMLLNTKILSLNEYHKSKIFMYMSSSQFLNKKYNNTIKYIYKSLKIDIKQTIYILDTFPFNGTYYPDKSIHATPIKDVMSNKIFYNEISKVYKILLNYLYKELIGRNKIKTINESQEADIQEENQNKFIKILTWKIKLDIILDKYDLTIYSFDLYYKILNVEYLNNNEFHLNTMKELASQYSEIYDFDKSIKVLNLLLNSNLFNYKDKDVLTSIYGSLSWYYLFTKDYKEAIKSSRTALELDETQIWIYTNLAHGYLLNNDIEKAKEIYFKYKGQEVGDKLWEEIISDDFYKLKKHDITSSYFKEIENKLFEK